jgi:hypothetical protein
MGPKNEATKAAPAPATTAPATTTDRKVAAPAPTTRATGPAPKANENPKMVEAGHKAAKKAKATQNASYALVYSFEFGGAAGLKKAYDAIASQEWAALAVARAVREAEGEGKAEAHKALVALLATLKPKAGVGPSVPVDPARAVVKVGKKSTYVIIRLPADTKLVDGQELAVVHNEAGFAALRPETVKK